ncbi:MAG: uroporphyrinogen-III C-methyltransferase [Bacteroidetes bacterium]|nr:uroporphyrinogen-III C-methyltransferase [Bacteroidota bacterium]
MKQTLQPKVILAGAGPGDAGLITVKAVRYLEKATFILTDRLVNPEIIQLYASPKARIIYVGKHGRRKSTPQEAINQLLVECAQKEGLTVRLKGGDVAFFSNVISEIETLKANDIPFELVPGITAASGASAWLNMPLTARNMAGGVRLLTYHHDEKFSQADWKNMATTNDTLVFYMSCKTLPDLVSHLKLYAKTDKGIAVIEQATTAQQRVLMATISSFDAQLAHFTIRQPALVVIGEVTKLYRDTLRETKINSFFKEHEYAC